MNASLADRSHPPAVSRYHEADACAEVVSHRRGRRATSTGIVLKRLDSPYEPGRANDVEDQQVRSVDSWWALPLWTHGGLVGSLASREACTTVTVLLHHLGFHVESSKDKDRQGVYGRQLDTFGAPHRVHGRAPGGPFAGAPSARRMAPLEPRLVVEVAYTFPPATAFRTGSSLLR